MFTITKQATFDALVTTSATGTTPITTTIIDLANYDSAALVVTLGSVSGTGSITVKAQQSTANSAGGMVDLTTEPNDADGPNASYTASASGAAGGVIVHEVIRPISRYLRWVITPATANSTVLSAVVIRFNHSRLPAPAGTTTLDVGRVIGA